LFYKWKTTSIVLQMKDNQIFPVKQIFGQAVGEGRVRYLSAEGRVRYLFAEGGDAT
jgi:hypothetical protein